MIATAGQDKTIKLTELKGSLNEIISMDSPSFVNDFCFDDSSKLLFAGCQNSKINVWNLPKKRLISSFGNHSESVIITLT